MPLILPANTLSAAAYSVDNSCRFNDDDSPDILKNLADGTRTKWTFSTWFKRGNLGITGYIFRCIKDGNSANYTFLQLNTSNQFYFLDFSPSTTNAEMTTNRLFRDPSAWYHVAIIIDTTDGTAGDRQQMWINGVRETSFASSTNYSSSFDTEMSVADYKFNIGYDGDNSGSYFDGYLAETVFLDGTDAPIGDLAEFDDDSPTIWKPKDPSGLTFGTNGFWLDYEASDNLGNDANGGTDFTETNLAAADQCQDSPTNNFVTLNPLNMPASSQPTLSEGNTSSVTNSSGTSNFGGVTTIGLTKGKWYVEAKAVMGATERNDIGMVANQETIIDSNRLVQGHNTYEWSWESGTAAWRYNIGGDDVQTQTLSTYTNGAIIGLYLDLDNHLLYAAENGTILNSGVGLSVPAASTTPLGLYYFVGNDSTSTSVTAQWDWNFGNGSYAGTAVSSAVADANGFGLFEYDPSDGGSSSFDSAAKDFYAICTKNLAEFG